MNVSLLQVRHKSRARKEEKEEEKEEEKREPTEEEIKWQKQLKKKLREFVPLPDIRIPVFDKSQCKEGEDTFMCMTDFLSKHYNRVKCDKRLRAEYYAK